MRTGLLEEIGSRDGVDELAESGAACDVEQDGRQTDSVSAELRD
jgi:hypothetical protein